MLDEVAFTIEYVAAVCVGGGVDDAVNVTLTPADAPFTVTDPLDGEDV
jgi:hypothetical protein